MYKVTFRNENTSMVFSTKREAFEAATTEFDRVALSLCHSDTSAETFAFLEKNFPHTVENYFKLDEIGRIDCQYVLIEVV